MIDMLEELFAERDRLEHRIVINQTRPFPKEIMEMDVRAYAKTEIIIKEVLRDV